MMVRVGSRAARSLEMVAPDVPTPLARVVDQALMFNKEDRWRDARAMQRALAEAYQATFDAPMPGAEDADDGEALRLADVASGNVSLPAERHFDRSSAVTVLTGATPVISQPPEPLPPGSLPQARRRPSRQTVLAAGIVLLAVAIGVAVTMTAVGPAPPESAASARESRPPSPAVSTTAAPRPAAWSAPVVAAHVTTAEPPSVPVESLPAVGQAAPVPASPTAPAATAAPPSPAPPRAAAARPAANCSPPFTTDPDTGKKKWKLECL
jgi:serine/threonine-protein kinase